MTRGGFFLKRCLLVLAIGCASLAFGNSIEELEASGHLHIESALTPQSGIVPGQKVTLTLEIATDRWFAGGTRIGIPEVPGLVILQTEQFASNASETHNGQTWAIQRWTLDVFPQRAGDFTIGPIPLQVHVNGGEEGDIQGELHSPARHFTAAIPNNLAQAKQWVAAPLFSVRQSFDRALDNLAVGDAFEQEVLLEASDVLAMMLPSYEIEKQPGLAPYPSPAVLENKVNRGQTLATRSIRISYVAEQPGQFLLPARDYFWWNTQSTQLEVLSLAEVRIEVGGVAAGPKNTATTTRSRSQQRLILLSSLVLLVVALRLCWLYLPRLPLTGLRVRLSNLTRRIRALRQPALASHLNPGNSAGD
jgi:hypothetical protein